MALEYRVVSIGTLSRNRFWNETESRRPAHATTTLIRDGNTTILVDPGLPPEFVVQRLDERAGLTPSQIDVVFLTNFRPVHRRGLTAFDKASWLMHEPEIDAMREHLGEMMERVRTEPDEVMKLVRDERELLKRVQKADERITSNVHLYPAVGATPGSAGLLLTAPSRTIVVAGDAVITREYYEAGRVFEQVADLEAAQQSFADILEVADAIVPGHDNEFHVFGR